MQFISIHAPPRGATRTLRNACSNFHHFNSRPSARGDDLVTLDAEVQCISIHAPPRGATGCACGVVGGMTFQFTPLREGRRGTRRTSPGTADISIHAPPRGATRRRRDYLRSHAFQFTPLREGRRALGSALGKPPTYFNSRPSARGDTSPDTTTGRDNHISIHAPPRGAT